MYDRTSFLNFLIQASIPGEDFIPDVRSMTIKILALAFLMMDCSFVVQLDVELKGTFSKLNRPKISTNIEDLLGINKKLRNNKLVINEFPISPFIEQVGTIKYLQDRGIDNEIINYFGIEYGTGGNFYKVNITNSLVIPVYDVDGTYYTFQVRKLGSDHNHRWCSPEGNCIQYMLYGGWSVSDTTDNLWIVEGASDVWNLFKYGIQSVGLFTKSASDRQINNIVKLCNKFKLNPVVCMDGDAYGDGFDCNMDIYAELRACGLSPRIVYLWKTEDPGMLSFDNIIKIYDILINHNICSAFEEGRYEGK
jgi:hypothetical protein